MGTIHCTKSQQRRTVHNNCSKISTESVLGEMQAALSFQLEENDLTWVRQGNWFGVNVPEISSDWRQSEQRDGAHGTNNNRIENCGLLMRSPAEVAQRCRPELRSRHCGYMRGGSTSSDQCLSRKSPDVNSMAAMNMSIEQSTVSAVSLPDREGVAR